MFQQTEGNELGFLERKGRRKQKQSTENRWAVPKPWPCKAGQETKQQKNQGLLNFRQFGGGGGGFGLGHSSLHYSAA